jgi:hypothetical protein
LGFLLKQSVKISFAHVGQPAMSRPRRKVEDFERAAGQKLGILGLTIDNPVFQQIQR